jgi:threonine aldolase
MLGGGMRQAGILAAACIHALDHHIERLAEDHENASVLAMGLAKIPQLSVTMPQTNIVFVDVREVDVAALQAHLAGRGINAIVGARTRLVTHLDVSPTDIARVLDEFNQFFNGRA